MRTLHVGLRVTDLERSIAFYNSLGYEALGRVPATEAVTLVMLKLPDDEFVSIELVHDAAHGKVDPRGLSHLVVNVEDIHDVIGQLSARGITADPPSSPDGSANFLTAWVADPDGFRIELVQWPAGHPPGMTRADLASPDAD